MGVCTKERKGVTAEVLMATPGTNSLVGESGGHRMKDGWGYLLMMMMFITIMNPFQFSSVKFII